MTYLLSVIQFDYNTSAAQKSTTFLRSASDFLFLIHNFWDGRQNMRVVTEPLLRNRSLFFPIRQRRKEETAVPSEFENPRVQCFPCPPEMFCNAVTAEVFAVAFPDELPMCADVHGVKCIPAGSAGHLSSSLQRYSRQPCPSTFTFKVRFVRFASSPVKTSVSTGVFPLCVVMPISSNPTTKR